MAHRNFPGSFMVGMAPSSHFLRGCRLCSHTNTLLVNIPAARITAAPAQSSGLGSVAVAPAHSRTHFSVGFPLWAGESQVIFGDGGGALMRDNSGVRALCPVERRVAEEEPPQDQWDVGRKGTGTGHCCVACCIFPSTHCQPGLW